MIRLNPDGVSGSSRSAYAAMLATPAVPMSIPLGSEYLYLDPFLTGPHVVFGIKARGLGTAYMRAGDVLAIPKDVTSVSVWNPLHRLLDTGGSNIANVIGYFCFRALKERDVLMVQGRHGKLLDPLPGIGAVYSGIVESAPWFASIPTYGLRGLRITVVPVNIAVTALLTNIPADFAATLTVRPLLPFVGYTGPILGALPFQQLPMGDPEEQNNADPTQFALLNDETTLVASGVQNVWDREVPIGCAAVKFAYTGLAGTGITVSRLFIHVEGR